MQISMFDGSIDFKINKPIRLIELFAGYGSQHLALNYLGVNCESWKICEWAVKSIQAYKDMHFASDNIDYSKNYTKDYIIDYLLNRGISSNYNEPMTVEQIKRLGEEKQRQIYNNIISTHNLVNIQQTRAQDLEIIDKDKYTYIMTYSFPCQDLSKAGIGKGMEKGSGTRSGMLWEVERILDECNGNLPQVLLMENVPDVIGTKNIKHFASWLAKLENLGYKCYWQVLNSKDYGVPQNRERCFMVSILGDYYYSFPQPRKLELKLKDILENDVDEKYYLSDKAINGKFNTQFSCSKLENCTEKDGIMPTLMARDYKDPKCVIEIELNGKMFPIIKTTKHYIEFKRNGFLDMENRIYKDISSTLHTGCDKIKIFEPNLKTKLCNELVASGKIKENDVIRHSYSNSRMKKFYASNQENHDCSPTLDTRCDCLGVVVNTNNKRQKELARIIDPTKDGQFLDFYNQTTNENVSGTITTRVDASNSSAVYNNFRIRKFIPKECFRLMGVRDDDFEKVAKNQSNASLYHLAGDSIVVDVLMAIFKKLVDNTKIIKYNYNRF